MQIQSGAISERLIDGLNLQTVGGIPTNLTPSISPTFTVNPKFTTILKTSSITTATTTTIYTTEPKRDFYLTMAIVSFTQSVLNDGTYMSLRTVVNGYNADLIIFRLVPLVAQSNIVMLPLPFPLKIDKNTVITFATAFTAGTLAANVTIGGFYQ